MLTELHIRQFALIEEACLPLSSGMTVFTGETGAGKSILVDALGAAFGDRASSDWVRHGAERAEVSAILDGDNSGLAGLLAEHDIDGGEEIILRRLIGADGRSRASVNGTPVPLKLLQQIGNLCLDLHGQHEHQALLRTDFQRHLLDERIDPSLLTTLQTAYRHWHDERKRLHNLSGKREEMATQAAWMREEVARLDALGLQPGLGDELAQQVESGRHFAQIQEAAATALAALEEGECSLRLSLAQAQRALTKVAAYRSELAEALALLEQMDALLGEVAPVLSAVDNEAFDGRALQAAEERLLNLHDALRRHGTDEAGLLRLQEDFRDKLSRLDTGAWDEAEQKRRLQAAASAYAEAAANVSQARRSAAQVLCSDLRPFLDRLALTGMRIEIRIEEGRDDERRWSERGWDNVAFFASSNPGEPFRELAAIASGGELSRFVLALKGCGAMRSAPNIAVFDEVDVGIGGDTAWCVGELLATMGRDRQVLVVSHLPQVAACADHHVRIRKHEQRGRTVTDIEVVEADARTEELARMLGGADAQARAHAGEMLKRGRKALHAA